ncbi:hypothetical protein [Micromonospora sp. DT47]|uniref:hypothetical protein n=1 Tax=Micromonospora sp. DT47 TaxID=3393431 RepID=UPI003CE9BFAC
MSDYQIRRDRHYDRLNGLHAKLLGYITGTVKGVDDGLVTAEQAIARIREEAAKTSAAADAAWDEYIGGAR